MHSFHHMVPFSAAASVDALSLTETWHLEVALEDASEEGRLVCWHQGRPFVYRPAEGSDSFVWRCLILGTPCNDRRVIDALERFAITT